MSINIPPPPQNAQFSLEGGKINPIWLNWLRKVRNASGGSIDDPTEDNFAALDASGNVIDSGYDNTSFVKVDGTQDIVQTGDWSVGGAVNKSTFEADGTLKFEGNATVWDDLQVNIAGVRVPPANAPTWTAYKGGFILAFSKAADEIIYFLAQLPHSYKEGSNIEFHLHTAYPDANAGNVRWNFTHSWASVGSDFPGETTVSITIAAPADADKHQLDEIAEPIVGTGKTVSSMLICSLEREGTDAVNDTYDDNVYLIGLDFHFEKDTVGSRLELAK